MKAVKWKLYIILNYVLIVIASITFLVICVLIFGGNVIETAAAPYFVALGFLALVTACIMNLVVYAKHFPHRILSGSPLTIHILSTILNVIAFLGLSLLAVVGSIIEFGEDATSEDQTGKYVLAYCLLLWLLIAFIVFCQLTLPRYLKRNNTNVFTTMIDSIGTKPDELQ
jgi:hypothetical protein